MLNTWSLPYGAADALTASSSHVYLVDRDADKLLVYDLVGNFVAELDTPPGEEPTAVDWNEEAGALYVGFFNGGQGIVRKYCGV